MFWICSLWLMSSARQLGLPENTQDPQLCLNSRWMSYVLVQVCPKYCMAHTHTKKVISKNLYFTGCPLLSFVKSPMCHFRNDTESWATPHSISSPKPCLQVSHETTSLLTPRRTKSHDAFICDTCLQSPHLHDSSKNLRKGKRGSEGKSYELTSCPKKGFITHTPFYTHYIYLHIHYIEMCISICI